MKLKDLYSSLFENLLDSKISDKLKTILSTSN